ncbi:MAG TPA: C13 family peptidase [Methylococcaceae bacterium]|nr:C13 family peptidase [Methylococcaceae bacterium]
MRFQYRQEAADLAASYAHLCQQRSKRATARWRRDPLSFPFFLALGIAVGWHAIAALSRADNWQSWALAAVALLFVGSRVATWLWLKKGGMNAWREQFAGHYLLVLSPEGLSVQSNGRNRFYSWPQILALEETEHYWLLYLRRYVALTVPKTAQPDGFAEAVRSHWEAHAENRGLSLPCEPRGHSLWAGFRRWLGDNLWAGFKLAFWGPVSPADFRTGTRPLLGLVLLELAALLSFGYVKSLPDPRFNIYGVTDFGAELLLFLLSGLAIGAMVVNRSSVPRLWVMLLSGLLVVEIPYLASHAAYSQLGFFSQVSWLPWALWLTAKGWMLLVVFRAVGTLFVQPAPSAWLLVSVFAFFNIVVPGYLPQQSLFYAGYEEEEDDPDGPAIDVEDTFYRQPQLLHDALAALQAERPGVPDLYFVGFAGQADEKVFANEIKYVRELFDGRFDTRGRSVALVNSPETVAHTPLANAHNLEKVLAEVSRRMNPDEDILFLYLTSHGSKTFDLSVSFWPMKLNDLPAARLKELLDRAGIKNRVVVVSACYSGGFVDALKDDNSLIIAAARRDRTSFGCGTESEFTYFGEAYFVDTLSHRTSFVQSFDEAKGIIAAREAKEQKDQDPSEPQLFLGDALRPRLQALEARLNPNPE